MSPAKLGLRLRIALVLALACLLAAGGVGVTLYSASEDMEDALIDQARSLELAGKKDDAIAAYRRVLKDVPTARRADDVRSRLASLGASPH